MEKLYISNRAIVDMFVANCSLASDTATLALETTTLASETATWCRKPGLGLGNRNLASETVSWRQNCDSGIGNHNSGVGNRDSVRRDHDFGHGNTTMAVEISYHQANLPTAS